MKESTQGKMLAFTGIAAGATPFVILLGFVVYLLTPIGFIVVFGPITLWKIIKNSREIDDFFGYPKKNLWSVKEWTERPSVTMFILVSIVCILLGYISW